MASTGVTYAHDDAFADFTEGVWGAWTNPKNAYSLDSTYASQSSVGSGGWGEWYHFWDGSTNLSDKIPTDATIDGVEIKLTGSRLGGTGTDYARLAGFMTWNTGSNYTAAGASYRKDFTSNTDAEITFGGPTTLWGRTWTKSDFETNNFAVAFYLYAISGTATGAQVDYITVNVYYTESGGTHSDTDNIAVSESITVEIPGYGVSDVTKSLSDTTNVSDSTSTGIIAAFLTSTKTDNINVTDTVTKNLYLGISGASLTDTISISESTSTSGLNQSTSILSNAVVSESLTYNLTPIISLSDTITVSEVVSPSLPLNRLTDTISVVDSTSTYMELNKSISSSVSVSDSVLPYKRVFDVNYIEDYSQTFIPNELRYRMISFTALDLSVEPNISYEATSAIISNTEHRIYFNPPVKIDQNRPLVYTILQEFSDYTAPSQSLVGQFGYIDNILNTYEAKNRVGTGLEDDQYYYYTIFVHKKNKNVAQTSYAVYDDPNSTQQIALSIKNENFDTRLMNYWPNVFKQLDTTDDLEDLMKVFGFGFNELYGSVKTFNLTDPDKMLYSILPNKSLQTGLSNVSSSMGVDHMRRIVTDLLPTWQLKGTKQGIVDFIRILTTWDVTNGTKDASVIVDETSISTEDLRALGFWSAAPEYTFTVTAADATAGATYTNNGNTYTVTGTITGGTTLETTGPAIPEDSGILTKMSGTGDSTIVFSTFASTHGNMRLFGNIRSYPPMSDGIDATPVTYTYDNITGYVQYSTCDLSEVQVGDRFLDGEGNFFIVREVFVSSNRIRLDTDLPLDDTGGGFIYQTTALRDAGRFYSPTSSSGIRIPGYFTFREYDVIINNIALYVGAMTSTLTINSDGTTTLTDSLADFGNVDSLVGNYILPRQDKVNEIFVISGNDSTSITMLGVVQNTVMEGEYAVLSPLNALRFTKLLTYMKEFEPSFARVAFQFT